MQSGTGWWWGPEYPNSTAKLPATEPGCPEGCLFNITADPTEHVDLALKFPAVVSRLRERLSKLGATTYQSDANGTIDAPGVLAAAQHDHWRKPWLQ